MRVFLSAIFCCLFCQYGFADIPEWQKIQQQKKADSLQLALRQTNYPKEKVDILNQISSLLREISNQDAYDLAMEASILAIKTDYAKGLIDSYVSLAIIAEITNQYRMSVYYWEQAIANAKKLNDKKKLSRLYVSILNSCFYLGDYKKILDNCLNGIPVAREAGDKDAEIHFLNSLGVVLLQQKNTDMALTCYQRSLHLSRELGDTALIGKTYNNLGKTHSLLNHQSAAITNYKAAIHILLGSDCIGEYASALNGIAKAYLANHNTDRALYYATQCADFVKKRGGQNAFDMVDYHLTLGEIYYAIHQYKLANQWLETGLNEAIAIDHKEFSKRGYEDLSHLFADQGDYKKAFEYQLKYSILRDSLSSVETTKKLLALETRAQLDKRDYDIQILSAENTLNRRNNFIRNIFIGCFLLVLALLFLLYNRYRLQQKNRLLAAIGNQQVEMFNTVVSLQDKERKRIAEDLHDGLGSTLSTIQLNLERLKDKNLDLDQTQLEQYNTALSLSNEAINELRNIAHNLMPSILTKLGLTAALQNHFDQIRQNAALRIKFETHGLEHRLEAGMEMSIFRIILEIMNNIIKHSKATEVVIQFVKFEKHLNITVEDNGIGFDPQEISKVKGIGIRNIASRIEFMNGTYSIDSSKGFGTTYIIDIPLTQTS